MHQQNNKLAMVEKETTRVMVDMTEEVELDMAKKSRKEVQEEAIGVVLHTKEDMSTPMLALLIRLLKKAKEKRTKVNPKPLKLRLKRPKLKLQSSQLSQKK